MSDKKVLQGFQLSAGVDIGHSMVKILFATNEDRTRHLSDSFETMVMKAIELSQDSAKAKAEQFTIAYKDNETGVVEDYYFGRSAFVQSNQQEFSNQKSDWFYDKEHDILVLGAWKRIMDRLDAKPETIKLVFGVPTDYFLSERDKVRSHLEGLLRPLLESTQKLEITIRQQSEAPLLDLLLNKDGTINVDVDLANEEYGVAEVGHFSSDLQKVVEGEIKETEKDSSGGVQLVYERLKKIFIDKNYPHRLRHLNRAIEEKVVHTSNGKIDVSQEVDEAATPLRESCLNGIRRIFGKDKNALRKLLVAGGGAPLVIDAIQKEFPTAVLVEHELGSRFSVASGLLKLAISQNNKEQQ